MIIDKVRFNNILKYKAIKFQLQKKMCTIQTELQKHLPVREITEGIHLIPLKNKAIIYARSVSFILQNLDDTQ